MTKRQLLRMVETRQPMTDSTKSKEEGRSLCGQSSINFVSVLLFDDVFQMEDTSNRIARMSKHSEVRYAIHVADPAVIQRGGTSGGGADCLNQLNHDESSSGIAAKLTSWLVG
jgi:hypothetical protein